MVKRARYLVLMVLVGLALGSGGAGAAMDQCPLCGMTITGNENTAMVVTVQSGEETTYCCPHCGLWVLAEAQDKIKAAKVRDFIKGEWIAAQDAVYLFNSKAVPACAPSWIAFGSQKDVEMFQKGFGGTIYPYAEALKERAKHPKGMEMPK